MMAYSSELGIKVFDKIGVEVHFIRLLYFTIFDVDLHDRHHYPPLLSDPALVMDLLFLLVIIMPLFALFLRYLTHPVLSGPYKSRWNALLAPVGAIPFFFFRDWDILFMSILVCMANMWVAWRQIDAGDDEFTWMQYYRDQAAYSGRHRGAWVADKVAAETYETIQMLQDPITNANFGAALYR